MSKLRKSAAKTTLQELFPEETARMISEREAAMAAEAAKPKPRGAYHDTRGKFTDRHTSEIATLQKECNIYKRNYQYYKRVIVRLSDEVMTTQGRVKELEEQLQQYADKAAQRKNISSSDKQNPHDMLPC